MKYNTTTNRRTIRLKWYDYSLPGAYFVTICSQNLKYAFGEINNGEMAINKIGHIVADSWMWLAGQYKYVVLDEWVIMPNHSQ